MRVLSMLSLLGFIIATSYVLKPVRSALFLTHFGAEKLPWVYIALAVVLGFISAGFSRFAPRADLPRLVVRLSYFFALNLLLFWGAIVSGWAWTGFLFYIWVSIFTALMPSLFWLLANYVFYANEGRRLFPLLMTGGLAGSIFGGAVASVLVPWIGTPGLMVPAAALQVGIALLAGSIASRERERMDERRSDLRIRERIRAFSSTEGPLRLLARSRYLTRVAALVLLTTLGSTLIDFQFNSVVESSFPDRDSMTRFLGGFFALVSFLAFILQVLFARPLLGRMGVGAGLLALPSALALSTMSFILHPGLLTAGLLKTADDGVNNSLNRASVEVLYLPITLSLKNRVKTWIDLFVERVSRGLGGLLILGATSLLGLGAHHLGFLVLGLVLPWMLLVLSIKREYVSSLRESIARRDLTDLDAAFSDPASRAVFHQVIAGTDPREVAYALELVPAVRDPLLRGELARLASHESPIVRAAALRALRADPDPAPLEEMERRVEDEDPEAGAEALALWLRTERAKALSAFERQLARGDVARISAALDRLSPREALFPEWMLSLIVERYRGSAASDERALAAKAFGFAPPEAAPGELLQVLLEDPKVEVARAAAASAGRLRSPELFPFLVSALARRPLRAHARRALARYGREAVPRLEALLEETTIHPAVRRALPRAIAEIEDPMSVEALFRALPHPDPRLHYQGIKGLARLRARGSSLRFARSEVERLLEHERRALGEMAWVFAPLATPRPKAGSHGLLVRVLEERIEYARERIFRILGLIYPQPEIVSLWYRISASPPAIRAAALEYLANLLSQPHRGGIFPLIERTTGSDLLAAGASLDGRPPLSLEAALRRLSESEDYWVAACAVTVVGELGFSSLLATLERLKGHPGAIVRESADQVLSRVQKGTIVT